MSNYFLYNYAGTDMYREIHDAKAVATTEIYTLSLHDALPISIAALDLKLSADEMAYLEEPYVPHAQYGRSEEHTSELQSHA